MFNTYYLCTNGIKDHCELTFYVSIHYVNRQAYCFQLNCRRTEYKKGVKATEYVEKRLADNENEMKINTYKYTGKYGRYIGIIWLEYSNISLNDELVQKGYAKRI